MVICQDKLHLIDQDLTRGHLPNFPIDIFFQSLAENLHERAHRIDAKGGSGTMTPALDLHRAQQARRLWVPRSAGYQTAWNEITRQTFRSKAG